MGAPLVVAMSNLLDIGPLRRVEFRGMLDRFKTVDPRQLAELLERFQGNVSALLDLVRHGTYWEDQQGDWCEGLSASALTVQQVPASSGILLPCFRSDQQDDTTHIFQFSHRWDGSPVFPHVHVMPLAAGSGVLEFGMSFKWLGTGGRISADIPETSYYQKTVAVSDRYSKQDIPLGQLEPPAAMRRISAFLIMKMIRRGGGAGNDTYTTGKGWSTAAANVALLGTDIHYHCSLWGSREPY